MPASGHTALKCSLHDWSGLRYGVSFVAERTWYNPVDNGPQVRQAEYSAWLIRSGVATLRVNDRVFEVGPGKWVFCFAPALDQVLSPDLKMLSIRMNSAWPNETMLFSSEDSVFTVDAADHPELEKVGTSLINIIGPVQPFPENLAYRFNWRTRMDLGGFLKYQASVLQWTSLVVDILHARGWQEEIPGGIDPRLAKALDLLDRLPMHVPFPTTELPSYSGLTIGQLNRLCVKHYTQTTHGYWERRRVHYARFQLARPGASVKEVAAELGFKQLSHFSTWFKRQTGHAPRTYQQHSPVDWATRDDRPGA